VRVAADVVTRPRRWPVPGGRWLARQVEADCGPGKRFDELGHRFGDWIEQGADAPAATVGEVEQHVAGYLELAAKVGHRWGTVAGLALGFTAISLAFTLLWLIAKVTA
jgi:hypothetical protein